MGLNVYNGDCTSGWIQIGSGYQWQVISGNYSMVKWHADYLETQRILYGLERDLENWMEIGRE